MRARRYRLTSPIGETRRMLPMVGCAIVAGVLIGLLLPPTARHLARPRLRLLGLLVGGAAAQVLAGQLDDGIAVVVSLAGFVGLLTFALANLHVVGMGVLAVGLGLNAFVMLLNGGMPVRARALVAADVIPPEDASGVELDGARHLEEPGEPIAVLGDI